MYEGFGAKEALEVKAIERVTNHDVKAVEYFLKKHFDDMGLAGEHGKRRGDGTSSCESGAPNMVYFCLGRNIVCCAVSV